MTCDVRWLIAAVLVLLLAGCGGDRNQVENVQPGAESAGPAAVADTALARMPVVTDTQTAPAAGMVAPQP